MTSGSCVEGAEFADYFWPAAEQMVEMSHEYWRTNGQFVPNVTVRLASGGYIGGGLYHSQNIEGWLTTLPGIRVVMPAFADDAAGLLRTAIRSRGITLFLEPKYLYNAPMARATVPAEFAVPFGKARIRREGTDLTIVTYGTPVHFALEAANESREGGQVARRSSTFARSFRSTSTPIAASVRKTSRVLVAHEDKVHGGFGGEIASQIQEAGLLRSSTRRSGASGLDFTPVGSRGSSSARSCRPPTRCWRRRGRCSRTDGRCRARVRCHTRGAGQGSNGESPAIAKRRRIPRLSPLLDGDSEDTTTQRLLPLRRRRGSGPREQHPDVAEDHRLISRRRSASRLSALDVEAAAVDRRDPGQVDADGDDEDEEQDRRRSAPRSASRRRGSARRPPGARPTASPAPGR